MYKLFDEADYSEDKLKEFNIEQVVNKNKTGYMYLIYLSMFNLQRLPLTRAEKRILDWAERLNSEKPANNTPQESILINNLRRGNV